LSEIFFNQIIKMYEGTRIGRQELNAELLDDVEGALWTLRLIDSTRLNNQPEIKR
jgi:phage terminase large subunit-like protein